jgi:2,3-bisphosphoglycerate-independent phosphoglycerate mutase
MQNVPPSKESGSDVACLSIMGYDPAAFDLGRGGIEAAALGICLEPGQVAFRLNLCYVEDGVMRGYSTDNISTEDGNALAAELKSALDSDTFTLYPGTSFRQVLVVNGHPELMGLAYATPHDNTGRDITAAYQPQLPGGGGIPEGHAAYEAAHALTGYIQAANKVLAASPLNARRVGAGLWPANHVWAFWPGMRPSSLVPFAQRHHKKAVVNSAVDLLKGLAFMTGMRYCEFAGVTDGPTNDFAAQGRGAISLLKEGNEVVIVHVEAPDAAGHDGRPDEKRNSIEQSDAHILAPLLEYARSHPLRIAVMPDHPTPLTTRKHSREPVPFVLAGPGVSHNGAQRMTEAQAGATGLLLAEGHTFMGSLFLAE